MEHDHAIMAGAPGESHAAPHAASPFTATELDSMHAQDMAAGRAVVFLMCGIFSIGVLIYTVVAISIAF